jgi:CDP-2,3-bis-(O-geranylgeranyl)-sn-glycerol synthase
MDTALALFLFFLPAGLANMAPVLANKIPGLNRWSTPLDFGKSWRGKRIFGANKRWRGLLGGILLGGLAGVVIYPHLTLPNGVSYFALGAALGAGALIADAIESFFKRQAGVAAGDSWFPWDQSDYIIGGLLFSAPFVHLQPSDDLVIFVIYFGLHLLVSYLGYLLKLKDKPI